MLTASLKSIKPITQWITGLAPGSHSLKIEVTPYKNAASSDYYQVIDAFVIPDGNTIAPSDGFGAPDMLVTTVDAPMGHAVPSDVWYCGADSPPNASDLSGQHCYQTQPAAAGSYFWWSCNSGCSLIEVYGRPDAEDGFADVYIDWNYVTTIDWVYGTIDDDLINAYNIFTWSGPPGVHNITLIATGTTDSTISNRALLQVDTHGVPMRGCLKRPHRRLDRVSRRQASFTTPPSTIFATFVDPNSGQGGVRAMPAF